MAALTVDIHLVVGLGNPGSKYSETRHNAGFWFIERMASAYSCNFKMDKKFFGENAQTNISDKTLWLFKPDTFMNESGRAVKAMASFYKINVDQILVIHDEIDLPPGAAKLKTGGGHGGHNGLRDVITQLGSKEFHRLRLGVGHPGNKDDVVDYVLKRPTREDELDINNAINESLQVIPAILEGDWELAQQKLHTAAD